MKSSYMTVFLIIFIGFSLLISNKVFATPSVTADINSRDWDNSPIVVNLNYSDTVEGVKTKQYKWDKTTSTPSIWNNYIGTLTNTSDGIWYLHYKSEDNANNVTVGYFGPYKMDATDPFVWAHSIEPNGPTNGNVEIQVNVGDALSNVKSITLPDNSVVTNKTTVFYNVASNGDYVFVVEDNAGNTVSHTVEVKNIDKSNPSVRALVLLLNKSGNYDVTLDVFDNSGISMVQLNDGTYISKGENDTYYKAKGLVNKPSSVTTVDKAGNATTANFLDLPVITYDSSYSKSKTYRKDLSAIITASGDISYEINSREYTCNSSPCNAIITKNSDFIAINTSGSSVSMVEDEITNIDKNEIPINFVGERVVNKQGKEIKFSWDVTLSSPVITCSTFDNNLTINPTGNPYIYISENKNYNCQLSGQFEGETATSETINVPVDYTATSISPKPNDNLSIYTITSNVYKEKTIAGDTYFINFNKGTGASAPIPTCLANPGSC